MQEWESNKLDIMLSDDCDLVERLEAAATLSNSESHSVLEALLNLALSDEVSLELAIEAATSLAFIWCRDDNFEADAIADLSNPECIRAITDVFIPYRPEWGRFLPDADEDY